jgi:hypothetical protein
VSFAYLSREWNITSVEAQQLHRLLQLHPHRPAASSPCKLCPVGVLRLALLHLPRNWSLAAQVVIAFEFVFEFGLPVGPSSSVAALACLLNNHIIFLFPSLASHSHLRLHALSLLRALSRLAFVKFFLESFLHLIFDVRLGSILGDYCWSLIFNVSVADFGWLPPTSRCE